MRNRCFNQNESWVMRLNGAALLSNVSCWTNLNIVAKILSSLVQFCPFPEYLRWHSRTCDPRVFLHLAFAWHEWSSLHSPVSDKPQIYTFSFFFTYQIVITLIISNNKKAFSRFFPTRIRFLKRASHPKDIINILLSPQMSFYLPKW